MTKQYFSGLYINTRTGTENKLYKNAELLPSITFFEKEEKSKVKNWKDVKNLLLYKMQKGELIYHNPMTDKELNEFCLILFKYFKSLEENK